jgi:hypothetical protein
MAKRKGTDNTMEKRKRTDNTMTKRKGTDNTMAKRKRTDNTMAKRKRTDNTMAKRKRTNNSVVGLLSIYGFWLPFGIFKLFLAKLDRDKMINKNTTNNDLQNIYIKLKIK